MSGDDAGVRLTVVGCSGSFPGPDSAASCYLLEAEHDGRPWRVLLDLGSGALGALQRYVDPRTLDAVWLSHLHPDHCADLAGLYVLWRHHPEGRSRRLPVWGPAGVAEQAARAYGLPSDPGMGREFDFHEHAEGEPTTVGPFTVVATRVVHPVTAYGLRVTASGRTLAYTGDSGPCASLAGLAADADLLLAEAAFQEGGDNPADLHLSGADAGRVARDAAVGRLVVTHVPPWYDPATAATEAGGTFGGPVELARTGGVWRI